MSLYSLLLSNSASALSLIKGYLTTPILAGVPISPTLWRPSSKAQVSRKVLVDVQGKKNVTDNVAPGPHEWDVEGYIGGAPFELTSRYMPSLSFARDLLDTAFYSRQMLSFLDVEHREWQVLMEDFQHERRADEQNRIFVRLHLVELNLIVTAITLGQDLPEVAAAASPAAGSDAGPPAGQGTTQASPLPANSLMFQTLGIGPNMVPSGPFGLVPLP